MVAPLRIVDPGNTDWAALAAEPTIVEVSTLAVDDDLVGIGASPVVGDYAGRMYVPQTPTSENLGWYLGRLCGIPVPGGHTMVIWGVRTGLWLGARRNVDNAEPPTQYLLEQEVITPGWTLPDGRFVFGLRRVPYKPFEVVTDPTAPPPGFIASRNGVGSGWLYVPRPGGGVGVYRPQGAGEFPGEPIGGRGSVRDMRDPYRGFQQSMNYAVEGPADVCLFTAIYQSDPATRPKLEPGSVTDTGALGPEERYLYSLQPNGVFRHVGGAIIGEIGPTATMAARGTSCRVQP